MEGTVRMSQMSASSGSTSIALTLDINGVEKSIHALNMNRVTDPSSYSGLTTVTSSMVGSSIFTHVIIGV